MALKVIGAGFGRTGTDSMRAALEILGVGPCHHMKVVGADPVQKECWLDMAKGGEPDWDAALGGFGSCVDWPSAFWWRELMERHPRAKVLLTWRTPESWWASMEKTIVPFIQKNTDGVARHLLDRVFGGVPDREGALGVYRSNVEDVLASVPPGRLILHRIGDGWGPLCAGLGLPVPDEPYPHANTAEDFNRSQS